MYYFGVEACTKERFRAQALQWLTPDPLAWLAMKQECSPGTQSAACERLPAVLSCLGRIGALERFWRASSIRIQSRVLCAVLKHIGGVRSPSRHTLTAN